MNSSIHLPALPYLKTDNVAELDAPRQSQIGKLKKQKPSVPAKHCDMSDICLLRKDGKCKAITCYKANEHITNKKETP